MQLKEMTAIGQSQLATAIAEILTCDLTYTDIIILLDFLSILRDNIYLQASVKRRKNDSVKMTD